MGRRGLLAVFVSLSPCFGVAQVSQQTPQGVDSTQSAAIQMLEHAESIVDVVLKDQPVENAPGMELATVPEIFVRDIQITGNQALSAAELGAITAEYEGQRITVEQLHELRYRLSRAYFDRGYVNSGVIIPDQNVSAGTIVLQVIEGNLGDIVIEGNRSLQDSYFSERVNRSISEPLNIGDLQASLRMLQEDPLVGSIHAQLVPGDEPGSGRLNLTINEQPPFELMIAADNHLSPSVSEERGTLSLSHRSLIGRGDVIAAHIGLTEGVEDSGASYSLPVSARDTRVAVQYSKADSEILEKPFDLLNIDSNVESISVVVSHPLIQRLDERLKVSVGFENKHSTSTLLGLPFSFSPGEIDGKAEAAAIFMSAEWMRRQEQGVFAARGTYTRGIDVLNSSKSATLPDSEFDLFVGQIEYIRRTGWRGGRLIAKSVIQLASEPLLAMYKLGVGGRYSVRGYRENLFVRDNGASASIEYQFPLFVDDTGRDRYNLRLAPFIDWGRSWDKNDALATSNSKTISSIGVGALWNPLEGFSAELYWGKDLDDQDLPTESWQDRGFHFRFLYQMNF